MERYPAPSQCAASLPRLLSPLRNRRVRRSGEHRPHDRRTPPQVGPGRGFQRAVRLGWVRPGLRTERRTQDDTPKGKMVRALLPSILKVLIQFGCCATATLAQVGMTPAGGRAACLTSIEKFLAPPVPPSGRRRLSLLRFFCRDVREWIGGMAVPDTVTPGRPGGPFVVRSQRVENGLR